MAALPDVEIAVGIGPPFVTEAVRRSVVVVSGSPALVGRVFDMTYGT